MTDPGPRPILNSDLSRLFCEYEDAMVGKTKRFAAKPPTQRQLRVGETIRHALSEILSRDSFFDPNLEGVCR